MKFDRRHQCGGQDAIPQERHAVEGKLTHLQSEFLFDLSLTLQAPLDIGLGPEGHRLIVMTSGGSFEGPRLSGTVLPLTGADWPRIRSDGTFALDARACFRTTEGALICNLRRASCGAVFRVSAGRSRCYERRSG